MNYFDTFAISSSGMAVQKLRADVASTNLANLHTTRMSNGGAYQPLAVRIENRLNSFATQLDAAALAQARPNASLSYINLAPRIVYEPAHPDANSEGLVAYPNLNLVAEMVTLMTATRAYQANVSALNAAKAMALKALEIGGRA